MFSTEFAKRVVEFKDNFGIIQNAEECRLILCLSWILPPVQAPTTSQDNYNLYEILSTSSRLDHKPSRLVKYICISPINSKNVYILPKSCP